MIADSIAFCREQGKRAIFDAEHFFDGYREDSAYALECVAAAADAGAENVTLCDTNGGSLPSYVAEATAAVVAAVGGKVEIGIHTHDDSGLRGGQLAGRGRSRRPPGPGLRQRLRRALRQRQPGDDPAGAAAEDGLRSGHRRAAGEPDHDRPLPRRALQPLLRPRPALRRAQRLRAQGRHARRRRRRRRQHLRAHRPGGGRQRARHHRLRAGRQGDDPQPGRARRHRARRRGGDPGDAAAEGARAPTATTTRPRRPPSSCCCGARPAPTSRSSGWRASASWSRSTPTAR